MKKINPLQFALNFEIKGTILYLKLAKQTRNLLTKKLFYSLASQEVEHARKVDEIYQQLKQNKDKIIKLERNLPPVEEELKEFFLKAKKVDLRKDIDNISGYELAMEMERKGYKAYNNFYNQTKNELEKKFFEQLIQEEKNHLDALANVYYYLTKTGDWFEEEESKIWNWMNL